MDVEPSLSLPDPPRELSSKESRALAWGHPATAGGALALALAGALIWLFVASYGLSFSGLRGVVQARSVVQAEVEKSEPVRLWTGEPAFRTTAIFSQQGQLYRAVGYGTPPSPLTAGQKVSVLMPNSAPGEAWVQGLQKYAIRLSALGTIAAMAVQPGLIFLTWGLVSGRRARHLVLEGQQQTAQRVRHWPLPRPLADHFLQQFQWTDQLTKTSRTTWTVRSNAATQADVLVSPGRNRVALVEQLLPHPHADQQTVAGTSKLRQRCAIAALSLLAAQAIPMVLFFLT